MAERLSAGDTRRILEKEIVAAEKLLDAMLTQDDYGDNTEKSEELLLSFSTPEMARADSPRSPGSSTVVCLSLGASDPPELVLPSDMCSKTRNRLIANKACLQKIKDHVVNYRTELSSIQNELKAELASSKENVEKLSSQLSVLTESYRHMNRVFKEKSQDQQKEKPHPDGENRDTEIIRLKEEMGQLNFKAKTLEAQMEILSRNKDELCRENDALKRNNEQLMEEAKQQADFICLLQTSNSYKSLKMDNLMLEVQELKSENNQKELELEQRRSNPPEILRVQAQLKEKEKELCECRQKLKKANTLRQSLFSCKSKQLFVQQQQEQLKVMERQVIEMVQQEMGQQQMGQIEDLCAEETEDLRAEETEDLRAEETEDLRAEETEDLRAEETEDLRAEETEDLRDVETEDLRAEVRLPSQHLVVPDVDATERSPTLPPRSDEELSLPPPLQDSSRSSGHLLTQSLRRSERLRMKTMPSIDVREGPNFSGADSQGASGGVNDDNKCYRHTTFSFILDPHELDEIVPKKRAGDLSSSWKRIFAKHLAENQACYRLQFSWAKINKDTDRYSWIKAFGYCQDHDMGAYRFEVTNPPSQDEGRVVVLVCGTTRRSKNQPRN